MVVGVLVVGVVTMALRVLKSWGVVVARGGVVTAPAGARGGPGSRRCRCTQIENLSCGGPPRACAAIGARDRVVGRRGRPRGTAGMPAARPAELGTASRFPAPPYKEPREDVFTVRAPPAARRGVRCANRTKSRAQGGASPGAHPAPPRVSRPMHSTRPPPKGEPNVTPSRRLWLFASPPKSQEALLWPTRRHAARDGQRRARMPPARAAPGPPSTLPASALD